MNRRSKKKPLPSSAIERFEQGRPNADDLRVAARLLNRPDLAAAADALSSALAWVEETEKSFSYEEPPWEAHGALQVRDTTRRQTDRQRAARRPAGPSEARP